MNMEDRIKAKVEKDFAPIFYELVNESHKHAGHAGDDGSGQTHFKLFLVSDLFKNQSRVVRQRQVYNAFQVFFDEGLHALSLELKEKNEHNCT